MQNVSQINLLVEVLASRVRKDIQGVLIESAVTHWGPVNDPDNDKDIPHNEVHLDARSIQGCTIGRWKLHGLFYAWRHIIDNPHPRLYS